MPLAVAQCDGLADKANPLGDLPIASALVRGNGVCRIPRKRAMDLPAIVQREDAAIMPDHKRKDRGLSQFFIVNAAVIRLVLRRQQVK